MFGRNQNLIGLEQPLLKTVWQLLKKLSTHLSYNPAIPLLRIYKRNENTCPHKNLNMNG